MANNNITNNGAGRIEAGWRRMGAELQATLYQGAPVAQMSGYGLPGPAEVAADRQSPVAEKDSVLAAYREAPGPDRGREDRDLGIDRE